MALGSLPPWLQINPRDYLLATQAGAQMGHAISDATTRAFEEQERMKMAAEHQKSVLAQQAIENAAQRLAAERLENYRQQEVANRQQQLGIEHQRLRSLDIQQQRADDLARHQLEMEKAKSNQRQIRGAGGRLWDITDPSNAVPLTPPPVRPPPKDPLQSALLGADAATLRATERDIQKRDENKPSGLGAIFHPGYQSDTDKLRKTVEAMRKEMQSKYGNKKRFTYNPNTSELTPVGEAESDQEDTE